MISPIIQAKNLSYEIQGHKILDDISLSLFTNEIIVLFGPSGGGKTTLCRNLALLDIPSSGDLLIGNVSYSFPLSSKIINYPYPQIGFVFQQLFLWPHLTNKENIALASRLTTNGDMVQINELNDRIEFICSLLGLELALLSRYPNEISLGQKQRVAIARSLILQPQFVFLDEVTASLDRLQIRNTMNLIEILKTQGVGIMLISHNLDACLSFTDSFIFIEKGKIRESGKNILRSPQSIELVNFLL